MKNEHRLWNVLNLLAIFSTAVVPAMMTWYYVGRPVEKTLVSDQVFATNLIPSLDVLGDRLSLSMALDNIQVKNLISATMALTNEGSEAILPTDFYEPLTINVDRPWSVIAVVSNDAPVSSKWHRINDQQFEADRTLINPGDSVRVSVYLTNTEIEHPTKTQMKDLNLNWATRVANLRQITVRENIFLAEAKDYWGVVTIFYGWRLVFFVALSMIFMAEYVNLLYRIVMLVRPKFEVVIWVVFAGLLSGTASDGITELIFPSVLTKLAGVSWYNFPMIFLNLILLTYLWWMNLRATKSLPD